MQVKARRFGSDWRRALDLGLTRTILLADDGGSDESDDSGGGEGDCDGSSCEVAEVVSVGHLVYDTYASIAT